MKSISNYDFNLLIEKLPILLRYAYGSIPPADTKAVNAIRLLALLHKKHSKTYHKKQPTND